MADSEAAVMDGHSEEERCWDEGGAGVGQHAVTGRVRSIEWFDIDIWFAKSK